MQKGCSSRLSLHYFGPKKGSFGQLIRCITDCVSSSSTLIPRQLGASMDILGGVLSAVRTRATIWAFGHGGTPYFVVSIYCFMAPTHPPKMERQQALAVLAKEEIQRFQCDGYRVVYSDGSAKWETSVGWVGGDYGSHEPGGWESSTHITHNPNKQSTEKYSEVMRVAATMDHRMQCHKVAGPVVGNKQGLLYFHGTENHGNHGNRLELKITENHGTGNECSYCLLLLLLVAKCRSVCFFASF